MLNVKKQNILNFALQIKLLNYIDSFQFPFQNINKRIHSHASGTFH